METGLQEYLSQNYNYIAGIIAGAVSFLLGVIAKLRLKYDTETKKRSEERFKEGEKEFERLRDGQNGIEEKIDSISDGLLILQTQHNDNHKGD